MDGSADRFLDLMHQLKDGNAAETQQATHGDDGGGGSRFISANSATAERMIRDNPGRPSARTQAANLMLTVSGEGQPAPRAWRTVSGHLAPLRRHQTG
jgi:hypothetical protein